MACVFWHFVPRVIPTSINLLIYEYGLTNPDVYLEEKD